MAHCHDCGADIPPEEEKHVLVDFIPMAMGHDIDFYEPACPACAEKRDLQAKERSWVSWLVLPVVAALVLLFVWASRRP